MLPQIAPRELKQRLDRGDDLVVLDVREAEELAIAGLAGVTHIPMGEITQRWQELDPTKEIVVLCHHGMRSAQVAQFLQQQQFAHVTNLAGGIDQWSLTVDPTVPRY